MTALFPSRMDHTASTPPPPPRFLLAYWNMRGLAEPIRLLLAYKFGLGACVLAPITLTTLIALIALIALGLKVIMTLTILINPTLPTTLNSPHHPTSIWCEKNYLVGPPPLFAKTGTFVFFLGSE